MSTSCKQNDKDVCWFHFGGSISKCSFLYLFAVAVARYFLIVLIFNMF